jgi:hypothetical protein
MSRLLARRTQRRFITSRRYAFKGWRLRRIIEAVISIAMAPTPVYADPSKYLCTIEQSVGFVFRHGEWVRGDFDPGTQYIVRHSNKTELGNYTNLETPTWGVFQLGKDKGVWAGCEDLVIGKKWGAPLTCEGAADVQFNRDTLRFQIELRGSYVYPYDPADGRPNDTGVSIGRCVPLN